MDEARALPDRAAAAARWAWEDLSGISIYAPFRVDDWKRAYYSGDHSRFAQGGQWGALLNAFWNVAPPEPPCTGQCEPPPPPIDPAPISAQVKAGHENIMLTWSLDEPVSNLIGYHVLRQISGTAAITLTTTPLNANQYIDASGLITGTTYCYQVRGVSNGGAVVAQSGIDCVKFGELTLWTPHIFASTNMTVVLVPVNVFIETWRAPASSEFSNNSLTTEAGRSTTSPAAICDATSGGNR